MCAARSASIAAASSLRAGEAPDRAAAGSCRRRCRRRRGRAAARRGRTTRGRSVDSGGRVGVVISRITTRPPGRTTRAISAQAALEVGEVARAEADRRGVELVVCVGQRRARWPTRTSTGTSARGALRAGALEHLLGEVAADDLAAGADARASSSARSPVPRRDVEHAVARADARRGRPRGAPAVVQPGRHDRVHEVVDARDAVEHRPHLRLLQRAVPARLGVPPSRSSRRYFSWPRKATSALNFCGLQLRERLERRHRRGRVDERARDRRGRQARCRSPSARARGRRCRSRRSCGTPGSPTGRRPACPLRTASAPAALRDDRRRRRACRSRSASRRSRPGRSGSAIAAIMKMPAAVAIGRRSGRRSGLRS